ncbi:MAG TPA: DNA-3-methyladenine glycosylase [Ktedonosporobacter sp.]|nr:DNA-3-methyladenine glycosylase [Ktedonosporobacter sp.]
MAKLPQAFYEQPTLAVAHALLGKTLLHATPEGVSGGVIVETEGYISAIDPAAHGHHRPTPRTRVMFGPPGYAYIYFSYGIHTMLNISTEPEGVGGAVLIRALQPTIGLDLIRQRRGQSMPLHHLARGPGLVCAALGIALTENGTALTGETLWLEDTPDLSPETIIATSPRIGISQAVDLPWRWYIAGCPSVSGHRKESGSRRASRSKFSGVKTEGKS